MDLNINKPAININQKHFARAERFELPSTVLETAILPLNYARRKLKAIPIVRNSF